MVVKAEAKVRRIVECKNKIKKENMLVHALQKLTSRAVSQPQGLLQRLKTLVDAAEKGN